MDNASLQKIKDIIARSQNVVVAVGANPSIDQMAGALSLYLTLTGNSKKVAVVSATEPIVELSSLVGIDKVKTSYEGSGGDLVVSFPYREGEIEKVSYTIDDGFLNIVVKAGEQGLTFEEQDVQFKRGSDKADLVISVGIPSRDDVDKMLPEESVKDALYINIDNANDNQGFGDVVLVSSKFSSLSEQVADLLLNLDLEVDTDMAQNLLSGIINATDNFQAPQTSFLAFEIAAILMKRGAVRNGVQTPSYQRPEPKREERQFPQRQDNGRQESRQQQFQRSSSQQQQPREDRREAIRNALRQRAQNKQSGQRDQSHGGQDQNQDRQGNRQSDQKPPSDWLTPKVYKGSTDIS